MNKKDLKHALVSLAIGVGTTAIFHILDGVILILKSWVAGTAGGATGAVAYLYTKYHG
jgi:glutamate synthase domain-containing protein 3